MTRVSRARRLLRSGVSTANHRLKLFLTLVVLAGIALSSLGQMTPAYAATTGETQYFVSNDYGYNFSHSVRYDNGAWQPGWDAPNAPGGIIDVATAYDGITGETQYAVVTTTGYMYHAIRYANGSWTSFNYVSTPYPGYVQTVAASWDGIVGEVQFMITTTYPCPCNGIPWHAIRYPNGYWSAFGQPLPNAASYVGDVSAAYDGIVGEVQFTLISSAPNPGNLPGHLLHRIRYPNGSWSAGWGLPPGDPANSGQPDQDVSSAWDGVRGEALFGVATNALYSDAMYTGIRYSNGYWSGFHGVNNAGANIYSVAVTYGGTYGVTMFLLADKNGNLTHGARWADGSYSGFSTPPYAPSNIVEVAATWDGQ
jgi:resuscitation-promoting factor RpfA